MFRFAYPILLTLLILPTVYYLLKRPGVDPDPEVPPTD